MVNNTYDAAVGAYPGFSGYPSVILYRKLLIYPSALLIQVPNRLDNDPETEINVYGDYDATNRLLHVVAAADMVYDFVAREIVDGWDGSESSVPASVVANQLVTYEYFDIEIYDDWDANKINVIVLLTDFDDSKNEIINANSVKLSALTEFLGVQQINNVNAIHLFPNPSYEKTFIRVDMNQTAEVSYTISDMHGKVVLNSYFGLLSGSNTLPVNTTFLPAGIYIATVYAGAQIKTEKLQVIH